MENKKSCVKWGFCKTSVFIQFSCGSTGWLRANVSAQPGAFRPCLSYTVVCTSLSPGAAWDLEGTVALLDVPFRPGTQLVMPNFRVIQHNCLPCESNNETYLPEVPGIFPFQSHFQGHISQRLQAPAVFYCLSQSASELMFTN